MEEGKKKNKKSKLDKILMGAIIGGAIGSVVGASLAPKKGKETRKDLSDLAKKATKESKSLFKKMILFIIKKRKPQEENETKKIPHEHV